MDPSLIDGVIKKLRDEPLDTSVCDAFNHIFAHQPTVRVINASTAFFNWADPFDPPRKDYRDDLIGYKVPDSIKDWLAKGLEESDKVLVLAAGNEGSDLSNTDYWRYEYIRSLLDDPRLQARIVLASNIAVDPSGTETFNGYKISHRGNTFGELLYLQEVALAAIGTDIGYGYNVHYSERDLSEKDRKLVIETGTSLSAPIISGYLTLLKQKNPGLNMAQIVQLARANAIPVGDPAIYGRGVINTDILLS